MIIEILGDGCSKCRQLRLRTEQAVRELGLEAQIRTVVDPRRLAAYRALSLPGLVVGEQLHSGAGSLSVAEIKDLLERQT